MDKRKLERDLAKIKDTLDKLMLENRDLDKRVEKLEEKN